MTLLQARGLWKRFGPTVALSDVNLELDRGLHVLAGPNGSGKTTLVRLWAGLIKPSKGVVKTLGVNPFYQRHVLMKRVGVELEDLALPWWTSGVEYLKLVARSKNAKWDEVVELARLLRAEDYWHRSIRGYSSGMRKRIVLIQALIGDPELVLLDEPYTLIDKETIATLNDLLHKKLSDGTTILISTHIFTRLEQCADTLTVLFNGRVVYHGGKSKLAEESVYVCRRDSLGPAELAIVAESARELHVDESSVVVKPLREQDAKWLAEKCEKLVDTKRIYEKTLGISST